MSDSKTTGSQPDGSATGLRCIIVTPESTVLDVRAQFVALPLFDGQRGVGRGHAPFIGRLGSGEVRIIGDQAAAEGTVIRTFVEGGFVEVGHDSVTIITQRAIPSNKIDAEQARLDFEKVHAAVATGDEAIAAKMQAEETARAKLRATQNAQY